MAESENLRAPTERMISAAKTAAERHGVPLPKGYTKDAQVCSEFLDKFLSKPTPKALSFAQRIAEEKGLEIPESALANSKALSAWIDEHK